MKSAVALALLLCMMTLSAQGYIYGGFGSYGHGLGGLYSGYGLGGYGLGGYGLGGLYGYGGHFPHHSYYGSRLYYNPIHGLHSHGSIHHHDTPVY